jgi:CheY-like chemotaxis protein
MPEEVVQNPPNRGGFSWRASLGCGQFPEVGINTDGEPSLARRHAVVCILNSVGAGLEMSAPTVLVVDDEPLVRWSVAETLSDHGYRVTTVADAAAAVSAMAGPDKPPDVVLLDLWLADRNDLDVLSAMHRLSPATKIILITAYGSEALFDDARRRGAFAAFDKPVEMSALAPLVARALEAQPAAGSVY